MISLYLSNITCFVMILKMAQPQNLASDQPQMFEESELRRR